MKPLIAALVLLMTAAGAPREPGPVGDWDFTARADPIRDRGRGANNLRLEGCEWVPSKRGSALRVMAGSARIWCERPAPALRPERSLSILAWVRPVEPAPYRWILDHGRGWGDDNAGYRLGLYENGLRFMLKADHIVNISGGRIQDGQWHQVAAVYDGKEARIFVNGEVVARHLVSGPIGYEGVTDKFNIGFNENGPLRGDLAAVSVFDRALADSEIAADWQAGRGLRFSPEELAAERYASLEKCALAKVPDAPFTRDRHTTLLAHLDSRRDSDADYARWDGRAGGGEMKRGVSGRFGSAVELLGEGAPILYRGAGNCSLRAGTCEFWVQAPRGKDPWADNQDRYLLTILPEWHLGYGKRPSLHMVLRKHAATRSLQFAAHTGRIDWYSHLNGATVADQAGSMLSMPLSVLAGRGWHHVVCSWDLGSLPASGGRIWLIVDGKGVTGKLAPLSDPEPPIPCYKVFLGGSYFPEVFCPTARAVLDEVRLSDVSVAARLAGAAPPRLPAAPIDERLMMQGEDLCRYLLDFTAKLQMGGGWECVYTWPNLLPDESPGTYAALAEDEYTLRDIVPTYLSAYEILGEDRYLRVAENCGQMLVKAQDEHGAWCQGYMVMPDRLYPVSPGSASIEEGTQTDPLRLLFWLWRLTARQEYFDAARRSAAFVLAAQKPDGAWPLVCSSTTMKPGGGYSGYSTLNDGTTLWGMKAMLLGWHLTGEQQYLDALRKAGEWVIAAQLPGQTGGWAEQYSDDGKPAWARGFEPPAACLTAVTDAADALTLMYDLTGDRKYLAPLRRCLQWGLGMPAEYKGYLYYDAETGEPITAKEYQLFRLKDAGFKGASPYRTSPEYFTRLQARLDARAGGPLVPGLQGLTSRREFERRATGLAPIVAGLEARRAATTKPLTYLEAFQRGKPAGALLSTQARHGFCFFPGRGMPYAQAVLEYLLSAKAAAGDMDPKSVPCFDDGYFGVVDPARDWYQTPLLGGVRP
jgi:Concanavalin A-like lectin/glucanases superfamily